MAKTPVPTPGHGRFPCVWEADISVVDPLSELTGSLLQHIVSLEIPIQVDTRLSWVISYFILSCHKLNTFNYFLRPGLREIKDRLEASKPKSCQGYKIEVWEKNWRKFAVALVFDMINTDGYSILHKILRTKIIQLLEICVPKSYSFFIGTSRAT